MCYRTEKHSFLLSHTLNNFQSQRHAVYPHRILDLGRVLASKWYKCCHCISKKIGVHGLGLVPPRPQRVKTQTVTS